MNNEVLDPGDGATNELFKKYYKEVTEIYAKAARELEIKSERFVKKLTEEIKAAATEEEKERVRKQATWLKNIDKLTEDLLSADKKAMKLSHGYIMDAYAENFNFGTYQIEHDAKVSTAFTLYDHDLVELLIKENPDLLPLPEVDEERDTEWFNQKISSATTQAVLQGDTLPDMTERLKSVTNMGLNAAVRTARTAMNSATNLGRYNSMKRAEEMGIGIKKEWFACLDNRTRASHRHLDGEKVGLDEPFSNGLMFPGDPHGRAAEVYNCRCVMRPFVDGVEYENVKRASKLGNMSYEEWKTALDKKEKSDG